MAEPGRKTKYMESACNDSAFLGIVREGITEADSAIRRKNIREKEKRTSAIVIGALDSGPLSSDSSDSSTPTGSPTSSVSCSHHFCGSLFAKCAEHGRWPLLQTFTNRESPLSRETFREGRRPLKSSSFSEDSININVRDENNPYHSLLYISCKKHNVKPIFRPSEDFLLLQKNAGKKVTFAKTAENCFEEDSNRGFNIKRHNSLPSRRTGTEGKVLRPPDKAFRESAPTYVKKRLPIFWEDAEKGERKLCDKNRQRSKSEDQINASLNESVENRARKNRSEMGSYRPKHLKSFLNKEDARSCGSFACSPLRDGVTDYRLGCDSEAFQEKLEDQPEPFRFQNVALKSKNESREWENRIDFLETEVVLLRRELKKRDQEKMKLQREVHKLKSVLQATSIIKPERDLLSSLQDSHGMPGQIQHVVSIPNPNKKQGISGESSDHGRNHDQIEIQRYEKDFRSKQLIKDAIMENDFLKNLDTSQVREIVESVYPMNFSRGDFVLREGESGSHLYVTAEGEFEVIKENTVLGKMGPGKAFGELAILYNCKRTASIKVVSDAKVWVLDRRVFQQIMMKTGLQRLQENINFLRSVPLLQSLSNEVLAKIADVLEVDFYPSGEHIIRQGASGDTFFIISSGSVKVTQQKPGRQEEEDIRILNKGDYFGEQALLKEDWRTANVIALSPGVECLTLDRDSFIQLIGDLSELQEKDYGDRIRGFSRPSSSSSLIDEQEYDYIRLEDLDVISTLGVGGFGRVELVQYAKNKTMTFALKCLKKQHIVETKQQEHVYSERNLMMACNCPFICRLYKTFRDSKYVYMLQEVLLGGEVWTILRERGYFDDYTTKFVTGCVVEAFEYLHARGIVYRDLKPENLLLDNTGYAKLVDFGFSKRLGFSSKTWTFCGTPEYLAPEIILNKGHDRAVDYWSLGILMHELLTGTPPFTAPDPMRTYNIILKGIDMIDFPKHITRAAQSLIKKLCRDSPSERLGYQRGGISDIKKHKWFQGFDWSGLKQRVLTPPISPLVRSPTDASNFDYYAKDTSVPPDEFSNWDAEF